MIDQWGSELVGGWHDWIEAPTRAGDALAEVIGAAPGTILVADSVTVNLFKLVNAILDARPSITKLATDQDNFPTDRYVLGGDRPRSRPRAGDLRGRPAARPAAGRRARGALTVLSHVAYRSGALADISAFPESVIWDLSHSAGAVPVNAKRDARTPSAAPTSTSTPAPARTGYLYVREPDTLVTPDPGLVRPSPPVRDGAPVRARARHHALPRRHAADPRPGRGRGGRAHHRRSGHRRPPREVDRPDRPADRAPRPVARRRSASPSAPRANRTCAAPTCRCGTRRPGRSARR